MYQISVKPTQMTPGCWLLTQQEQNTSSTISCEKVRQPWHIAFPPPWCGLFTSGLLGKSLTLAEGHSGIISTLAPIPLASRYGRNNRDVVDVCAWRNPFLLDARPHFLKDSTSKMRSMEMSHAAAPQSSEPQLKYHVDRFKTGYEMEQVCVCFRWQNT